MIKTITTKKTQTFNFLEWNNNILISSVKKINLNIILIVILDILFYLSSGFLITFWLQRIQAKMAAFNLPTDIISLGPKKAQQLLSDVRAFYFLSVFSFIFLLIAIIFLASIFKGIIWAKTTNSKINFALISKFFGLNLIWMGFWFLLIILISLFIQPTTSPIFMISSIILGLYFTNTLYTIFMKKPKFSSILDAIKLNIAKIHLFLLPYAIIYFIFYIILKLTSFIKFKYSTILLVLVMVVYASIVRYYISTLVLEIEGTK